MKKLLMAAVGLAAFLGVALKPIEAQAVYVTGSTAFGAALTSANDPDIHNATAFTLEGPFFTTTFATGHYFPIPNGADFNGGGSLIISLATLNATVWSNTYGSWVTTSSSYSTTDLLGQFSVLISLLGTFTPTPALDTINGGPGLQPTLTLQDRKSVV